MLVPSAMAAQVQASVAGMTGGDLVSILWMKCCEYITQNAMVTYAWIGTNPTTGVPDPVVIQTGKLTATPHGLVNQATLTAAQDAATAMTIMGSLMTSDQAGWVVTWDDPTFVAVPPVIVTPGIITLAPSGGTDTTSAFSMLCASICQGIMSALCTPTVPGTHAAFVGTASFTSIT